VPVVINASEFTHFATIFQPFSLKIAESRGRYKLAAPAPAYPWIYIYVHVQILIQSSARPRLLFAIVLVSQTQTPSRSMSPARHWNGPSAPSSLTPATVVITCAATPPLVLCLRRQPSYHLQGRRIVSTSNTCQAGHLGARHLRRSHPEHRRGCLFCPRGEGESIGFRDARIERLSESTSLTSSWSPSSRAKLPSQMKLNAADLIRKLLLHSADTTGYSLN